MRKELVEVVSAAANAVVEFMAKAANGSSEKELLEAFCDEFSSLLYGWQMRIGEIEEVEDDE